MDEKKKKNRKKKGSQSKITEGARGNAEKVTVQEQNHSSAMEQNHHAQNLGNGDQSGGVSESDIELERHKIYRKKLVKLQEEIRQLEDEKNSWLQKQVNFEEKIEVLQNKVDCCSQKEASLEAKLNDLQIGNDSAIQKEVILEDRVKNVEGIKDIWLLKETSIREMVARLEDTNINLQMQVKELEESRSNILQESQQLVESVSGLELRIQRLEREASFYATSKAELTKLPEERKSLNQIEAADALIKKPDTGNGELAGKVTEQYVEPNQQASSTEHSIPVLNHDVTQVGTSADYMEKGNQERFNTSNGVEDFVADPEVQSAQPLGLDEPRISEDTVPVPMDEIQIHEEDLQGMKSNERPPEVPLSDAPLTGAPFRLISFVTRYVSGADLVNQ